MRMIIVTCFLILSFFCFCTEKQQPQSRIEYEKVKSDTNVAYIKRTYNRNNKLTVEEYLGADSANNGFYRSYYRSSLIKVKGNYRKGLKDGIWYKYDTLGKIMTKQNWLQGKQFGEQFFYGKDGGIEEYYFTNLEGKAVYHAKFKDRKIIQSQGAPFYLAYTSDTIKCNDRYELLIFFGIPPGTNYNMSVKEYLIPERRITSEKKYDSMDGIEDVVWGKRIVISEVYKQKSTYEWDIKFAIKDIEGVVGIKNEIIKTEIICK